jgi:hypothetical protein
MRRFNVTGLCVPQKDYMVDINGKLEQIMQLIDDGCYFTINRARQYGKTTTLSRLQRTLPSEYTCVRLSFEGLGDESFASPEAFCRVFMKLVRDSLEFADVSDDYRNDWFDAQVVSFDDLKRHIKKMCKDKKIVLMIDETDKTSNNRVFLHFIGILRDKFLLRKDGMDYTFHSVIFAGVYNIKNIKLKMINEGLYTPSANENKLYNSPWNIAIDFKVDMSFCPLEINTMLNEYESDHNTGMDINAISDEIYNYTSGYPFLVSRICQHIDEIFNKNWTLAGVREAVDELLYEQNTLFDDLFKNLENNADLYNLLYDILIVGEKKTFNLDNPVMNIGAMYGIIKESDRRVNISNRIFEIRICNYFISKNETKNETKKQNGFNSVLQCDVIKDGIFNMELCLYKFAEHYAEIYTERDEDDKNFFERHGRMLFLSYLRPLINGQGFYHIESQFTDLRRMDLIVDFGKDQFIIELKLWHGNSKHEEAHDQLLGYMDSKNARDGYLLTFDFRKDKNKPKYAKWVYFGEKRIYDVLL